MHSAPVLVTIPPVCDKPPTFWSNPKAQPILVGHHSQRRHARDLGKMQTAMSKRVELTRAADRLERRAGRAEKSDAVSSDDPEAIAKLRAKLADVDKSRARMRDANAAVRAGGDVAARLKGHPRRAAPQHRERRQPLR